MISVTQEAEGLLVVKVNESRLDAKVAVGFKQQMFDYVEKGSNRLLLDLSNVNFIDSSGLGSIVSVLKKTGPNGKLAIAGLNVKTQQIFELTRMNRVFEIFDTVDSALEEHSSQAPA